ncbi:MAG: nitroreductase family protein, partial [Rhodospirillales bacterium]|nr:nitroreductase family protein [Rhodospirillales bacterium]
FISIVADFRYVNAFPVLNDGSELDKMYHENAERILLQSVAAATMAAHLAASAFGYGVWWVTAIGQDQAQTALKPILGVPDDLSVIDIMCFGPPLKEPYTRWKKDYEDIVSVDQYDMSKYQTQEQIDEWIRTTRHKVMYKDKTQID